MPGVQKNRANMITDITSNIYNNIVKFITGDNLQQRLLNLEASVPNILSDKDAAGGYVGLDANGQMLATYVTQTTFRAVIQGLASTNDLIENMRYVIANACGSTRELEVMVATSSTLFPAAKDLQTGETGIYNITTDTFIQGGLVTFKKALSNANLLAGGVFDIAELPAPGVGYAWVIVDASCKSVGMGTVFDGNPNIQLEVETASRYQFDDQQFFLQKGTDEWSNLFRAAANNTTIVENKKAQVNITVSSAVGDGTITIYGTARLITL